jgi:hypothetical protein
MNDKTMLTTRDVAVFLGVTLRSLGANWFRWGLTAYRVGRRNLYRASELERFLTDHRCRSPGLFHIRGSSHGSQAA